MDLPWKTGYCIMIMEKCTFAFISGTIRNIKVPFNVGFQLEYNNICTSLLIITSGLILFVFYSIDVDQTETKMFKIKKKKILFI